MLNNQHDEIYHEKHCQDKLHPTKNIGAHRIAIYETSENAMCVKQLTHVSVVIKQARCKNSR